jgi:hypothetical protein
MSAWAGPKFYALVVMSAFGKQDITFSNTDIASSVHCLRFFIIPLQLASRLSLVALNLVRMCEAKYKNGGKPVHKTA